MENYFKTAYPRRLEELRNDLDEITLSFYENPINDEEEGRKILADFQHKVKIFATNNELHLKTKKITGLNQFLLLQVSAERMTKYFSEKGSKGTAFLFMKLYKVDTES